MPYSGDRIMMGSQRESRISHFRGWVLFLIPVLAILFQVYVPLFIRFLRYLKAPLLITIYFALMRRSQIGGLTIGALVGLSEDSLSSTKLGMSGISDTLVGYFAASIGLRIDVEHPAIRLIVCFLFLMFHEFIYWVLTRALLAQQVIFDAKQTLVIAFLNALVGVALFHFLDKLKDPS
jgi:rod shape-determining protein MreD